MIRRILAVAGVVGAAAFASPALADCYANAAERYGINVTLLRAISFVESRHVPDAVGQNTNGTEDLCAMQINSWWLDKLEPYGITRERLLTDHCTCVNTGAWILAQEIARHGATWRAVARYHSPNEDRGRAYSHKVHDAYVRKWQAQQ